MNHRFGPLICLILLSGDLSVAATSDSPSTVRVAAIQFISRWAKPKENRRDIEPFVREAAKNGAKIVVLPETAITAYMSHDIRLTWQVGSQQVTTGLQGVSPEQSAETVPGDSTRIFGALAKELGIYLTVPLVEFDPGQKKYYNTLVLVDPAGAVALHYRKLNPWPWAERGWASPGDHGHQYLDTPYGRLGLLICYDINFEPPKLKQNNIDHLLYSIAWVDDSKSTWFTKQLPDIARIANVNIIGANWSIPDLPGWHGYGQSLILLRTGEVAARVKSDLGSEIIYADLPIPKTPRKSVEKGHRDGEKSAGSQG
jgi:predicted amidohydrolase